jgi:hypothetical protein
MVFFEKPLELGIWTLGTLHLTAGLAVAFMVLADGKLFGGFCRMIGGAVGLFNAKIKRD